MLKLAISPASWTRQGQAVDSGQRLRWDGASSRRTAVWSAISGKTRRRSTLLGALAHEQGRSRQPARPARGTGASVTTLYEGGWRSRALTPRRPGQPRRRTKRPLAADGGQAAV